MSRLSSSPLQLTLLLALAALAIVASAFVTPALADIAAYGGQARFTEVYGPVTVRHAHDWSEASRGVDLFDPAQNDFSSIEIEVNWEKGRTILPSPALDHVWATEDAAWIVGLSNLKIHNPHQLVIWDGNRKPWAKVAVGGRGGTRVPGTRESVTNHVYWFDADSPDVELHLDEDGTPVALSVDGNEGRVKLALPDGELLEPTAP